MAASTGEDSNPWKHVANITYNPQTNLWSELDYAQGCLSLQGERDEATGRVSGSGQARLETSEDAARFHHMGWRRPASEPSERSQRSGSVSEPEGGGRRASRKPETAKVTLSSGDAGNICLTYKHSDGERYTYTLPDAPDMLEADAEVTELGPFYVEDVDISVIDEARGVSQSYRYSSAASE